MTMFTVLCDKRKQNRTEKASHGKKKRQTEAWSLKRVKLIPKMLYAKEVT